MTKIEALVAIVTCISICSFLAFTTKGCTEYNHRWNEMINKETLSAIEKGCTVITTATASVYRPQIICSDNNNDVKP